MPITLNGTTGITSPGGDTSTSLTTSGLTIGTTPIGAGNASRFKNRIINGDMRIDQRNAGASVTPTTDGSYTLDRYQVSISAASKFSVQQSSTAPTGFINSALITSLSAYSVPAGGYFMFNQLIEGLNVADLGWGTANAKTVTLSFQVYSSLTGTFGGAFQNSAQNRAYPFSYTISTANTWTSISVTVAGDTSGTWLTTNGTGITVRFGLGVGTTYSTTAGAWTAGQYFSSTGATSVVGTNGATFYITGVQLEVGSSATGFEYVDYGTQFAMCQRYYEFESGGAFSTATNGGFGNSYTGSCYFKVLKRTTPTVTIYSGNGLTGTSGSATWYPGSTVATATLTTTSTSLFSMQQSGTSTYNLVSFSFSASAEL
jgi:hypothetical protein